MDDQHPLKKIVHIQRCICFAARTVKRTVTLARVNSDWHETVTCYGGPIFFNIIMGEKDRPQVASMPARSRSATGEEDDTIMPRRNQGPDALNRFLQQVSKAGLAALVRSLLYAGCPTGPHEAKSRTLQTIMKSDFWQSRNPLPVVTAAQHNHPKIVGVFLQFYEDSGRSKDDFVVQQIREALQVAVTYGRANVVEMLLAHGAAPVPFLLHTAFPSVGHDMRFCKIVELFFKHGLDPNTVVTTSNGWTPIFYAAYVGCERCIGACLAHGAKLLDQEENNKNDEGGTTQQGQLHKCSVLETAAMHKRWSAVRCLVDKVDDATRSSLLPHQGKGQNDGTTTTALVTTDALLFAIEKGSVETVELLVKTYGINVTQPRYVHGQTQKLSPLQVAQREKQAEVEDLLKKLSAQ